MKHLTLKTTYTNTKTILLKPSLVKNLAHDLSKTTFNMFITKHVKLNFAHDASLKPQSQLNGFKKSLYNRVLLHNFRLEPNYNRRKHSISHYMLLRNQYTKLSKVFGYLSKNQINFFIAYALKNSFTDTTNMYRTRPVPTLVSLIESKSSYVLFRNLASSKAFYKINLNQGLNTTKKQNYFLKFINKPERTTRSRSGLFYKKPYNYYYKIQSATLLSNTKLLDFGQILTY